MMALIRGGCCRITTRHMFVFGLVVAVSAPQTEPQSLSAELTAVPSQTSSSVSSPHTLSSSSSAASSSSASSSSSSSSFSSAVTPAFCAELARQAGCDNLPGECLDCMFNCTCVYGSPVIVECMPKKNIDCRHEMNFKKRTMICRYCYQSPPEEHICEHNSSCQVTHAPRQYYTASCTVRPDVICLGRRVFLKRRLCNWTRGYSWSTALLLSVALGGFGVDRFYLGMWQEGIGKLFSFGGLGVWTLVDVVLIATGYLGPADGSLYIP